MTKLASIEYFNDSIGAEVLKAFEKLTLDAEKAFSFDPDYEKADIHAIIQETAVRTQGSFSNEDSDEEKSLNVNPLSYEFHDTDEKDEDSFYTVASNQSSPNQSLSAMLLLETDDDISNGKGKNAKNQDEWEEGDDDNGYIIITIPTEEFFIMEEECACRVNAEEEFINNTRQDILKHLHNHLNLKQHQSEDVNESPSIGGNSTVSTGSGSGSGSGSKVDKEESSSYDGMVEDLKYAESIVESLRTIDISSTKGEIDLRNSIRMMSSKTIDSHSAKSISTTTVLESSSSTITTTTQESSSKGLLPPKASRRISECETRRSEIIGQRRFLGSDKKFHSYFNLKVIFDPTRTGFEEHKNFIPSKGTVIAGRYEVNDVLGQAAFSTALQCADLIAEENEPQWVCLKVIKNNKDFFDQSMDEIKLLQYINTHGDPDKHHILRLVDFFYYKEHLFIVSELLRENLYEFGRYVREEGLEPYYTFPRLKKIMKQVLEALAYIHSLNLIHCDVKPENIVIKSYSRCEVKLIDFGSSCFTTDSLTTYIQSRSYRAPEVIIGHKYDGRIDVWSMGAVLAELYTGYVLFQNDSVPTMLARISAILGPMPHKVLVEAKESYKYYTSSSIVYEKGEEQTVSLIIPKKTSLVTRLHLSEQNMTQDEELFVDFVRVLLNLDPVSRVTAAEALQHKWLADVDTLVIPPPSLNPTNK